MTKKNNCHKCNQKLAPNELVDNWVEYRIYSQQLNPDVSAIEKRVSKFDLYLCENCYQAEKDKYLGKKEYTIFETTHYPKMSSGYVTWKTIQDQEKWTMISEKWLEIFKKKHNLKSINLAKDHWGEETKLMFIGKDGKNILKSRSLEDYTNVTTSFYLFLTNDNISELESAKVFKKYLEHKGGKDNSTPPPPLTSYQSNHWTEVRDCWVRSDC